MNVPTYHLRRVNPKTHHPEELILLGEVTKFGRNADNVDVVLTSAVYSNMISRDHAVIMGRIDPITRKIVGYKIRDNSLNGTYIDDKRVKDEMALEDSSVIKFGHMNGAAIKAGAAAPQANAEFSFVFEKCGSNNRRYIGWEGYERRKTVVCTGDGKFMTETGEDHRTKKRPPPKEPVSSTTTHNPPSFPIHHTQPTPPTAAFNPPPTLQPEKPLYQSMMHAPQGKMAIPPFGMPGHHPFSHPALFQQQQLAGFQTGLRQNGQYPPGIHAIHAQSGGIHHMTHQQLIPHQMAQHPLPPQLQIMDGKPSSSSTVPIRSPPVECDSSVPSPPKNGTDSRTGNADSSSQQSPRRGKDDDEDSFSVPDSPPRAPRPIDIPGRSVTNSPAPPSPRPAEKVEVPKEEKKKSVTPKKASTPGKVPKSGGGSAKKKNNEVDRLLTDLTEGSFMMEARRKSVGGAGSERRKMLNEGKKSVKRAVSKNKLHRQLSSASSDEESDDDESSGVPHRTSSASRPSMVGKKASSSITNTPKGTMKRSGGSSKGRKEESDESDPYEESDEGSGGEMKNGKRKMSVKSPASAKKEKTTPKVTPKKIGKKKKKKGSDDDDLSASEVDEGEGDVTKEEDPNDHCGHAQCKSPKMDGVHWVECDGCEVWYHNYCVFSTNIPYKGKTFYCGCGHPSLKKKKT